MQNFCYAHLKDYKINEKNGSLYYKDGTVEDVNDPMDYPYKKQSLIYLKLYPFILVLFFLFGPGHNTERYIIMDLFISECLYTTNVCIKSCVMQTKYILFFCVL